MNYLTEYEIKAIEAFNENEVMKAAVRKVITAGIYQNGTLEEGKAVDKRNWVYGILQDPMGNMTEKTDEEIGQSVRAAVAGLTFIEDAFKTLEKYKRVEPKEEQGNEAR